MNIPTLIFLCWIGFGILGFVIISCLEYSVMGRTTVSLNNLRHILLGKLLLSYAVIQLFCELYKHFGNVTILEFKKNKKDN